MNERMRCLLAISVICLCLALLLLLFDQPAYANPGDVLVNRATGVDVPGCGGVGNPCYSIMYAVQSVAAVGDRVLVAPGTYTETFWMKAGVNVVSQSGPDVTIIDGENVRGGPMVGAGNTITSATRLEGFTVKRGKGGNGAGIEIEGGSPVISNCIVRENSGAYGGGIQIVNAGANVLIQNSQILTNTASGNGGGIRVADGAAMTLTHSTVLSDTAGGAGGAIVGENYPTIVISDTLFRNNHANYGGAINGSDTSLTLLNSQVYSNTANSGGGGIYVSNTSTLDIHDNIIQGNVATQSAGIGIDGGTGVIEHNTIRSNVTSPTSNHGGINVGGGTNIQIRRNWISDNSGAGLRVWGAQARVENNFIIKNRTGDSQVLTGGNQPVQIVNNTIVGNGTYSGIQVGADAAFTITNNIVVSNRSGVISHSSVLPTISYNDVWNNSADNYEGQAIGAFGFSVDPRFVDLANDDYHLGPLSLLVDAGLNTGAPTVDYDGDARPFDGNGDGVATVDVGADERMTVTYYLNLPLIMR